MLLYELLLVVVRNGQDQLSFVTGARELSSQYPPVSEKLVQQTFEQCPHDEIELNAIPH